MSLEVRKDKARETEIWGVFRGRQVVGPMGSLGELT